MPSSDYSSAVGGGLKLKGAKDAGIDKKKKKKKRSAIEQLDKAETKAEDLEEGDAADLQARAVTRVKDVSVEAASRDAGVAKTEAERQHEERRRKRLEEKMKKEGIKTHKERVEELNKYLSGLSEHHDMPRIGPG